MSKGLHHIQIHKNAVWELVQNKFVKMKYIQGNINLSNMFTKEDKDVGHFIEIQNVVLLLSPH